MVSGQHRPALTYGPGQHPSITHRDQLDVRGENGVVSSRLVPEGQTVCVAHVINQRSPRHVRRPRMANSPPAITRIRIRLNAARSGKTWVFSVDKTEGGVAARFASRALAGGLTGPAVVPGLPEKSLLIDAINYGELYQMPPKSKLPSEEFAILTRRSIRSCRITLAPKKLIRTRRASEGSASEPSLARRVSMCKDAKLSCRGNILQAGRGTPWLIRPLGCAGPGACPASPGEPLAPRTARPLSCSPYRGERRATRPLHSATW